MQSDPTEFEQYTERVSKELLPEKWPDPIPFQSESELPAFPLDALPDPVHRFAEALAEATQTAPAMAGITGLGVLSALFQGKYTLQINSSWSETLSLYTLAVAPPASRKSSVFGQMMQPVRDMEQSIQAMQRADLARSEAEINLLKDSISAARRAAAQGDKAEKERMLQLSGQLAETEEKYPFQMITGDATPEALALMMYQQNGCITCASAEGGGLFDTAAGKYSKQADISIYLQAHDGDSLDCSRITRKGFSIRSPRLSMILAVQPQVLESAMQNPVFTGRGLIARLLPVFCPQKFGERAQSPPPVPASVSSEYNQFISAAFGRCIQNGSREAITLSKEADSMRQVYGHDIDVRLDNEWSGDFSGWAGKLCGTMLRIAALLYIGDCIAKGKDPCSGSIDTGCMYRAICIADCLAGHAERMYQTAGIDFLADARHLWAVIHRTGQAEISKRELFRKVQSSRYPKAADMDSDLEILKEMEYIRTETVPAGAAGGRPSVIIRVNPLTLK